MKRLCGFAWHAALTTAPAWPAEQTVTYKSGDETASGAPGHAGGQGARSRR